MTAMIFAAATGARAAADNEIASILITVFYAVFLCGVGYLLYLLIRSLRKRKQAGFSGKMTAAEAPAQPTPQRSVGEAIKSYREQCKMTQELLAERLGVSRQAVSKWESNASEPSTANLIALARLFSVTVDDLLRGAG